MLDDAVVGSGGKDVTAYWTTTNFDVDYKFKTEHHKVTGFFIKNGPNELNKSPDSVTVTWDFTDLSKPTMRQKFALAWEHENQELYFDLKTLEINEIRFSFDNKYQHTELNQIELFGHSAEVQQKCDEEVAAGSFTREEWFVYDDDRCVRAERASAKPSGCLVESWNFDVPKAECCRAGTTIGDAQLKLAC